MDNKLNETDQKPRGNQQPDVARQSTMAMEIPFTFVGAVALGGGIGFFLDKWLHTAPWLLVLFGCFGFAAGILDIARRFRP